MSHAEILHALHPAAGATDALVDFVSALRYDSLSEEVRHYARRHLLDTVGVMIAGAGGTIANQAEAALATVRAAGAVPVPGRARRADLLDAAFLGGTAAHGIELDDGYTKGSVHPGCTVIPSVLAVGFIGKATGKALIEAVVAGYETVTAIGRACHPALRHRGFHPTGAVAVFGAAMTTGKLRGLTAEQLANAMGIAASSAAGLFAFVNGGADIKRLHPDFATAQLSFPYLMAVALKFRGIKFDYFDDTVRRDPAMAALAQKFRISAPPEIDRLYPQLRPARVTVTTARGQFIRQADEALGSRLVPLDDAGLKAKFCDLVAPVHGSKTADDLAERLWTIDQLDDVSMLFEALAK